MAGDWIKMRGNLWDDPRVACLCDITSQSECAVIGALYWLWATADQHTEDGALPGMSMRAIDRKVGIAGFAQALCDIAWLADHQEGVRILKFEEHNGASAKRRCTEAQRKTNARNLSASDADNVQTEGGQNAESTQPPCVAREREEKEEAKACATSVARFPEFWTLYPSKVAKKTCLAKWKLRKLDSVADTIIADVKRRLSSDSRWRNGYVPNPETYLNQDRWDDGAPVNGAPVAALDPHSEMMRGVL